MFLINQSPAEEFNSLTHVTSERVFDCYIFPLTTLLILRSYSTRYSTRYSTTIKTKDCQILLQIFTSEQRSKDINNSKREASGARFLCPYIPSTNINSRALA